MYIINAHYYIIIVIIIIYTYMPIFHKPLQCYLHSKLKQVDVVLCGNTKDPLDIKTFREMYVKTFQPVILRSSGDNGGTSTHLERWNFSMLSQHLQNVNIVTQGNVRDYESRLDLVQKKDDDCSEDKQRVISFEEFLRVGASSPKAKLYAINVPLPISLKRDINRYENLFGKHWSFGDYDSSTGRKTYEELLFIGRKASRTGFHQDYPTVLTLLQIAVGTKLLLLFPPDAKILPEDESLFGPWSCFSAKQLRLGTFANKINAYNGCVALLNPGDTLVIPPDWWHAAVNLTDSIAISKGMLNGMNIQMAFEEWKRDAKKQRSENRDFPRLMRALKKQKKKRNTEDDIADAATIERISAEMTCVNPT